MHPIPSSTAIAQFLSFFSGKNQEKAREALVKLEEAVLAGGWPAGYSRPVKAAFNKSNVLANLAKRSERLDYDRKGNEIPGYVGSPFEWNTPERDALESMRRVMRYGLFEQAGDVDVAPLMDNKLSGKAKDYLDELVRQFIAYRTAAEQVADLVHLLDITRPKPVFTTMNASPTITKTMEDLGAAKVEVCPIEYREVRRKNAKTGKEEIVVIGFCKWPDGTRHGTSRFSSDNCQCESCGHAIKNPFNWVPLLVTDKAGAFKSIWVGRDCAETLFGVKLTGELELAEGPAGVVTIPQENA